MEKKSKIIRYFKYLNKKRRDFFRIRRLKSLDISAKKNLKNTHPVKRILLFSTSKGWGDSLFVLGFLKELTLNGFLVHMIVPTCYMDHYRYPQVEELVNSFESRDCAERIFKFSPDLVIDLDYVGIDFYEKKIEILKRLSCPKLTVNQYYKDLNVITSFISIKNEKHISERYALILREALDIRVPKIYPVAYFSDKDDEWAKYFLQKCKKNIFVYINSVAGDSDRCLSKEQLESIINMVLERIDCAVIYNSKSPIVFKNHSDVVYPLPEVTFSKLSALLSKVDFVITPDTSVTHIASAFNIKSFVIFPPNDRDFWQYYSAAEAWSGLSDITHSFYIDDIGLKIDDLGYSNRKTGKNYLYSVKQLNMELAKILDKL